MSEFSIRSRFVKVDDNLGLVLGWAIVCKENGKDYFDLQGDHIPEDAMLKAASDFMLNSRTGMEMHRGGSAGKVVFAWPMTTAIAKAFGLSPQKTGLMIGFRPDSPEMLAKFRDGSFTGFSIGGMRLEDEEID